MGLDEQGIFPFWDDIEQKARLGRYLLRAGKEEYTDDWFALGVENISAGGFVVSMARYLLRNNLVLEWSDKNRQEWQVSGLPTKHTSHQ